MRSDLEKAASIRQEREKTERERRE